MAEELGEIKLQSGTPVPEVVTGKATFYPIYENHTEGFILKEIPQGTTHFFREFIITSKNQQKLSGDNIIPQLPLPELLNILAREYSPTLKYLGQHGIELILGDVVTPSNREEEREMINVREDIGLLLLGTSTGALLGNLVGGSGRMGRRRFLKLSAAAGVAAGAWALSAKPFDFIAGKDFGQYKLRSKDGKLEELSPEKRIILRAHALQSHLHPEEAFIFFRNLVMAHKLLDLADDLGENGFSKRPQIAIGIGYAHGGIEDFLSLGKARCLDLAKVLYTSDFYKALDKINYGAFNFATTRVVKIPDAEDLSKATDYKHVDNDLAKMFLEKLKA